MDGHKIMIGDFNLVLDPKKDRKTKAKNVHNNSAAAFFLLEYMERGNDD